MTKQMPPEGDEYNKQREEELYAAITNKASLARRYAEMLRDAAPLDQLNEATAAMAQMERDIARLSLELHNSTQGKNLTVFLERMDTSLGGVTRQLAMLNESMQLMLLVSKESTARLGKIDRDLIDIRKRHDEQISELLRRADEGNAEDQRISREIEELRSEFETYVKANKRNEYEQRLTDLEARRETIEAHGDGH